VFAFLSDMRNHWKLEHRFLEVDSVDADTRGGRVRMVGPFGIGRVADTRVVEAREPSLVLGSADLGRTRAAVRWDIRPADGASQVTLSATIERLSPGDRLLLLLGGRRWLQLVFASALSRLEDECGL
jgi:hypothetical protein